jgi:hypothetical protein
MKRTGSTYGRKWLTRARFLQGLGGVAGLLVGGGLAHAAPPTIVLDDDVDYFAIQEQRADAGQLSFRVQDADGDTVQVTTIISPTPNAGELAAVVEGTASNRTLRFTTGAVCKNTTYTVTLVPRDNDSSGSPRDLKIEVIHTQKPQPPELEREPGQPTIRLLPDSDAPITVQVKEPPRAACGPLTYDWAPVDAKNGPKITGDNTQATLRYPESGQCADWGKSYLYTVSAKDAGGLLSDKTPFLVQVLPWGKPLPAFPSGEKRFVFQPGTTGTVVPEQRRQCVPDPVSTRWTILEGTLPREGLQVFDEKDQPIAQWPVTARELQFQAVTCAGTRLRLSAVNRAEDGSGLEGEPSTCQVTIDPQWTPLASGRLGLADPRATPSSVEGGATVGDLNCLEARGGVEAKLRLTRVADEALVEERAFKAPGTWRFGLADNCEGGLYRVTGTLSKNVSDWGGGGELGPGEAEATAAEPLLVTVPPVKVQLGPLGESRLVASCGAGAQGVLRQPLPAGPCARAQVLWSQVDGPALTQPVLRGQEVNASIPEGEFAQLIGSEVALDVRADTPGGEVRTQKVTITADPFVEVRRVSESRSGSETSLFGVAVELRNTTTCGVSEVTHVERLEGLDYVEGSARLEGAPVEAVWEEGTLTVTGVALEAGATRALTYVVRPRLLGKMAFAGGSSLRGLPVSFEAEEGAEASAFGCEAAGPSLAALGLAAGGLALRRRRREG